MMDPPSGIRGRHFWTVNSTPFTLISKIESKSSSLIWPSGAYFAMPAFANRTSSFPFSLLICATIRSMSLELETSARTVVTLRPISWAAAANSASRRPVMKTYAPSATNSRAVARPIPLFPPVRRAPFPSSLPILPSYSHALPFLGCGLTQKIFNFAVQIPRDRKGIWTVVGSQQASHPVIGQMDAIGALVHQDRDRRVGACVRSVLHHFLHDEWIADHDADPPGRIAAGFFSNDPAMVKLHEEHQSGSTQYFLDGALQLGERLRAVGRFPKFRHVRMAHGIVDGGENLLERLRRGQAESLKFDLA